MEISQKIIIFYLFFVFFSKCLAYAQKEIIRNQEREYQPGMKDPGDRRERQDLTSLNTNQAPDFDCK